MMTRGQKEEVEVEEKNTEGGLLFSLLELLEEERKIKGLKKGKEEITVTEEEEEASAETTGEIAAKTEDISTGKTEGTAADIEDTLMIGEETAAMIGEETAVTTEEETVSTGVNMQSTVTTGSETDVGLAEGAPMERTVLTRRES